MPSRRLTVNPHLSYEELTQRYQHCRDSGEKTRWLAIRLMSHPAQPMTVEQVAEITGFTPDWVRKLIHRYNREGGEGLRNRQQLKPGGKPLALNLQQQQQLYQRLQSPPDDKGLWTAPKVGEYIEAQFGIRLHPSTAWQYLKRLGFSLQVPRPLHQQAATQEEQQRFQSELAIFVACLQHWHPDKCIEVWAEDEARLGLHAIIRRTWALCGQRPQAHHYPRYQWLYTYGFVHPDSGDSFFLLLPRVNCTVMSLALHAFAAEHNPKADKLIVLLVDQARWHMSQRLELPDGIILFPLLAYTPQLQPTECVWPLLREAVANQAFDDLDALETLLVRRCQWLMAHPKVVQGKVGFDWIRAITRAP